MIGAAGTAAVQTYNHRTRWDERTLTCYASFLGQAAATFGSCCLVIDRSGADDECDEAFEMRYAKLEPIYEELILLDEACSDDARRLMWVLWHAGRQDIPQADNLIDVTRVYRDARHHVRRRAESHLIHRSRRYRWQREGCQPDSHSSPLGRPANPEVWPT